MTLLFLVLLSRYVPLPAPWEFWLHVMIGYSIARAIIQILLAIVKAIEKVT